jgi:signal transduction histidine kinase
MREDTLKQSGSPPSGAESRKRNARFTGRGAPPGTFGSTWVGVICRYGLAVVAVALATVLRWWLGQSHGVTPTFVIHYPAVLLVASIGGGGPGILATVLSALAADYWLLPPFGFGVAGTGDVIALGIFTGANLFLCGLAEQLRRGRWAKAASVAREETLRDAKDRLEDCVRERTVELEQTNRTLQAEIAERRRAEEAVKQERQRFNDVLEMLPVYVALLTPDYHVPFANRDFRQRFGESHGRRCFEYLFGRQEPCEICETYKVLETKAPHRWEWTGPDSHNYDIFDFPFTDTNGSPLILEMGIDITERKRLEVELRRANDELERRVAARTADLATSNKELEAFAYSVSHDLRAPLRAMDGFSQALLEDYADRLDAEGKGHLQRVRAASQRMADLIDGMLSLSRTTRSEMRRTRVDLSRLAQSIAGELRNTTPQRPVEFVIAPGLVVDGDMNLLRTVLENLLGNAWKFTSKHAQARIELGVLRRDGETVYFVRDDGAGFDMTYASNLFEVFRRLHAATDFEGTGVGLATVQRIVNRHGGRVWAEGQVEKGAALYFTLLPEPR